MGPSPQLLLPTKPPEFSAFNAIFASFVAGLGAFVFGYSLGFTSPVLTAMEILKDDTVFKDSTLEQLDDGSTWVINSPNASLFGSIVNIGAMTGSLLGGVLLDKLGRQRTICLAGIPFTLAWTWTASVSQFEQLVVARFIVGLTVGVISMSVPVYIGEIAPTHLRGGLGAVNQFAVTIGILTAYVVGIVVEENQATAIHCTPDVDDDDDEGSFRLHGNTPKESGTCQDIVSSWKCEPLKGSDDGGQEDYVCHGDLPHWRVLCWVAAAASALLFVAMLFMPETPTFLFEKRRFDECRKSLLFLRGNSAEAVEHEMQEMERAELETRSTKGHHHHRQVSTRDGSSVSSANLVGPPPPLPSGSSSYFEENGNGNNNNTNTMTSNLIDHHHSATLGDDYDDGDDGDDIRKTDPGHPFPVSSGGGSVMSSRKQSGDDGQGSEPGMAAILCAPDVRLPLIMGVCIMLCQQFSGINAVIFYSGSILQTAGMDNANLGGVMVMAAQVVCTGISIILMDRAGRRVLLGLSAAGMAVSGLALAAFFFNAKKPAWLALTSLLLYIVFFSLGMGPIPWLFMGEIFPAHAKAPAASIATVVNWTTSFVITELFPFAQSLLQPQGTFILFSAFCVAAATFAYLVMPETKGKTFEEIAQEFKSRRR